MKVSLTLKNLVDAYPGKVRVVYKNFVVHPDTATAGHMAACAAGEQGKFLEFTDVFWAKGFSEYMKTRDPKSMNDAAVKDMAKGLGLDMGKFEAALTGDACKQRLAADMAELSKFGVSGTPAFFVNGQMIPGALPEPQFKALVDQKLKEAEASGVSGEEYYDKMIMQKGEKKFRSKLDPKPS